MTVMLFKRKFKKPIGYRFYAVLIGISLSLSAAAQEPIVRPQVISLADAVTLTLEITTACFAGQN